MLFYSYVQQDMCSTASLVSLDSDMTRTDTSVLPPVSVPDFMPAMTNLPPLNLTAMPPLSCSLSSVAAESISSMASSMPNCCPSRNTHGPAMSDSGISMDAGFTSSASNHSLVNPAGLSKLGSVNVNSHGE